ncbi:hypothetical protein DU508_17185 [Pedobacter chinensis]|uniref:Uncharacterized protein n=2 Tax=Sphingobacteriaceae TaxID=84566 RepID=A0A369PXJ6_9SPHI|nr:MAG: hypothetical protein DI598_17230 [Pseudopedobacter saltans]RDC55436.1 hypothetical protein DU508_17185 [Pedobacter chinensis]
MFCFIFRCYSNISGCSCKEYF